MEAREHQGTMRESRGAETLRRQTQMLGLRIWFLLWKHLLDLDSLLDAMEMSRRSLLVRHLVFLGSLLDTMEMSRRSLFVRHLV